jgi:type II restriction enzyme
VEAWEVQARWKRYESINERPEDKGWLRDTLACIQKLEKQEFHLDELYSFEENLSQLHPRNRHIQPKIRQQLQVLCREGIVERLEPGVYRKLPV